MSEGYFVERNNEGRVVAIYAREQPGIAEEFLDVDHAELVAFFAALEE